MIRPYNRNVGRISSRPLRLMSRNSQAVKCLRVGADDFTGDGRGQPRIAADAVQRGEHGAAVGVAVIGADHDIVSAGGSNDIG